MRKSWSIALSAALLLLGFAARQADSQSERWRGGDGRDGVCVYENADFRGWEQCYGAGESIPDLGNRRNRISSVRIMGRAQITLFEHPNFGGREVELDDNVSNLRDVRGWNDQADSLRVSVSRGGGGRPHGSRPPREDRVCVYQHVGFQGSSLCWDEGEEIRDLKSVGWNDGISSIRTFGRTRATFYEHVDFRGERLTVDRDIADLTRVGNGDRSDWNDRISSVRVRGGR